MSPAELREDCNRAKALGLGVRLAFPKGTRMPRGFPRGELLCVNPREERVYLFPADRVLGWLDRAEHEASA